MGSKRLSTLERIVGAEKIVDLSLADIRRLMDLHGGSLDQPIRVHRIGVKIRLVIRCRHESYTSWSMSIIVNAADFDGRVDGIDWEILFVSIDGLKCRGFHKHQWNPKAASCERYKLPLPNFTPATPTDFLVDGLKILNVTMKEGPSDDLQMSIA